MKERGKKWVDPKKGFVIHPDMGEALRNYRPGEDSIKGVFQARDRAVQEGQQYWNTDHDDEMAQTARERSQDAGLIGSGWRYPEVKRRKKRG